MYALALNNINGVQCLYQRPKKGAWADRGALSKMSNRHIGPFILDRD